MSDQQLLMKKIYKNIEKLSPVAIDLNNYLADNPEVSGKEYNSSKEIVKLLENKGMKVVYPFGGLETAFKAEVSKNKNPKLRAAILVEYDALPEIGHGCGHSASGAISILAGLALNEIGDELPVQIDLIGTPDEEVEGGKAILVENGIFDDYDIAIMIHMDNHNRVFSRLLAVSDVEITFKGKTSHASASPWEGKNALNGVQLFFHAVDMLRQHVKTDVKMHGVIKEGGKAANIVPDLGRAHFFIRSNNSSYLDEVMEKVKDCARGAALATQTEVEFEHLYAPYTELVPCKSADSLLSEIYKDLDLDLGEVIDIPFGSSDIGNVSQICPAFHPTLAVVAEDTALHTKEFAEAMKSKEAYKAIREGAEIISKFLITLALDDKRLTEIKMEHAKYLKSK